MTRATINDVASAAGVSLATVDRVLNQRSGVRAKTIERVERAIRELNYSPNRLAARLARRSSYNFCAVLPEGTNSFMRSLETESRNVENRMAAERVVFDLQYADVFNGNRLAEKLSGLDGYDGVAVVALDHPAVREAINTLAANGTTVVTLVSDAPDSARAHYVGINNTAAGRTAAALLGRFVGGRRGKVGMIAGSLGLRDHAERQFGFEQMLAMEHPELVVLPVREGRDDWQQVQSVTEALLADTPDLVGLYNVGAGNRGVVAALEAANRSREVVFIAHELTLHSRQALVSGTIDAILNQDAGHEIRSAIRVMLAHVDNEPIIEGQERIRIDIFLRDNLP